MEESIKVAGYEQPARRDEDGNVFMPYNKIYRQDAKGHWLFKQEFCWERECYQTLFNGPNLEVSVWVNEDDEINEVVLHDALEALSFCQLGQNDIVGYAYSTFSSCWYPIRKRDVDTIRTPRMNGRPSMEVKKFFRTSENLL